MKDNKNEFRQPVSVDDAPGGSVCEWCGKPAVRQLIAQGGKHHNEGGFFCDECGKEFIRVITGVSEYKIKTKTATAE